jgi:hypothetical protein
MSYNYTTWQSQLANLMIVGSTDTNFQTFLPGCIDYAEQRIYRELDLVFTTVIDATGTCSSGSRLVTLPSTWVVVEEINVITPSTATAATGSRNQLVPITREYINYSYPSNSSFNGVPQYWNLLSQSQIMVGPAPDAPYVIEVIGTQRPTALSSTNTNTFLTQYLPDLFMAASMVFASGYLQNFGSQSDNPQQATSWESQYQALMKSASVEEARKKFQSEGWTTESPSPIASPKRV